ncbi:septum formation initiator family protein [Candidatus Campbellbacteria bacterium]|nr:MAG: septum formation initiator family protein [Candidatus Campbellbacteria bacterium]
MADFKQKQKARRLLYSNVTLVVLSMLLLITGKELWDIFKKRQQAEDGLARVQAHYQDLLQRKEFLSSEIQSLETPEGIESKLRGRYSIAKSGEKVIVLVADEKATSTEAVKVGWWSRLWGWLW